MDLLHLSCIKRKIVIPCKALIWLLMLLNGKELISHLKKLRPC